MLDRYWFELHTDEPDGIDLFVESTPTMLTPARARELAAELLRLADEWDAAQ